MQPDPEVWVIKYAVYLMVLGCALYYAALIGGVVLSVATRLVAKVELSDDAAATMMALVIGVTAAIVLSAIWWGASAWVALAAGSATAFLVGTGACLGGIKAIAGARSKETNRLVSIGLLKAAAVSAVVTFAGAAMPFIVLLLRELTS